MTDAQSTFSDFLNATAAKKPTPGGGAVAAAAGALAAAMGEMVLNYSVGKKDLAAHQEVLSAALQHFNKARQIMLELLIEDQLAYEALTAAKKANAVVEPALLAAIRIPQTISATAATILAEAQRIAPIANRWLLSDLAVCAELAMATVRSGTYNVRVNLADINDVAERKRFADWCEDITARSRDAIAELIPTIWRRIESAAP
jgi:formiminotetrahydrofolate cyclodeaminase